MKNKIKCVIVDDKKLDVEGIRYKCERFDFLEVIGEYTDAEQFLIDSSDLDFDVCFLDFEMPVLNGIEIATELKDKNIIFVTGNTTLTAAEMFNLDNIVDYVTKPISIKKFNHAVNKVYNLINNTKNINNKQIHVFNTEVGKVPIRIEHMRYIGTSSKIDSRDKLLVNIDGSHHILKNKTIDSLINLLPQKDWIQINSGSVIHVDSIKNIPMSDLVELKFENPFSKNENIECTIGNNFKKEFKRKLGM